MLAKQSPDITSILAFDGNFNTIGRVKLGNPITTSVSDNLKIYPYTVSKRLIVKERNINIV